MKLAITGMIASGKSEILKEFSRLGWLTLSSDELARQAAGTSHAQEYLREHFGGDVPSREELRGRFLESAEFRGGWLDILHPIINQSWCAFLAQNDSACAVVEIPLLFEKKLEKNFDRVVVCSCNIQLALLRWEARGGRKEEYEALAGLLMPLESKLKRADFIVENDSTLPTLQNAVQLIHTQLLNQSQYV